MNDHKVPPRDPNPLTNILFNILIPVMVLNQLGKRLGDHGPLIGLILALCFPIAYAFWDYWTRRHKNYISLLGIVSILFTGGFALLHLEGMWFVVKDAAFPGLLGLAVAISSYTSKPLVRALFCNERVLSMQAIEEQLEQRQMQGAFDQLIRRSTRWMSASFFMSSSLNFWLARRVFVELDPGLPAAARSQLLNEQIARMTGYGFIVIALPSMILTGFVLYYFLRRLSKMTELSFESLLKS